MNILDIQNRLRELNREKYPSDEEIEEKERLIEELALQRNGARKPQESSKLVKIPEIKVIKQKREHTVIGKAISSGLKAIVEHFKEKPVTMEEIDELKKQAVKFRLKADIAKSKATIRKSKGNPLGNISGTTKSRKPRSSKEDDISSILRGAVSSRQPKLWSNSSGRDIRKSFYG